jgi:5-formyltetrahydrofolate cyclo-ligase
MKTTNKTQLRQTYCTLREDLTGMHVADASTAVCRRLATMTVLREARTVLSYLAFRNEIDLDPLFEFLPGIDWVLPRIEGERLVLHTYQPDDLVPHAFGMLEPSADAPRVDPVDLDVVLVPGVAFDPRGGRLGFGGGFYDRLLVRTSAIRIGVTYDQCMPEELPCAPHDQRMDWVVTPTRAIHTTPLWRRECSQPPA